MKIFVIDPLKEFKQQVYQYPQDYVEQRKKINTADLLELVNILKKETQTRETHPDPQAVESCWQELQEKIKEIK